MEENMMNELFKDVGETSGIYAIVMDGKVLYIGQAKNMNRRVKQHYRYARYFQVRHKYRLLHQPILNNQIKFVVIQPCDINHLGRCEKCWIERFHCESRKCPPLNNLFGQDIASFPYDTFIKNLNDYAPLSLSNQSCLNAELSALVDKP